mmetsp:Transcript_3759/g.14812  ORF Transcript_3759/g.14812 Transcript_3759/m.14812 type:complete len:441 (+) Transcript_3759:1106-2428(+)
MQWQPVGTATDVFVHGPMWFLNPPQRWSPRAGAAVAVQHAYDNISRHVGRMFLSGGYASWPCEVDDYCHPLFDGQRAQNDVWSSLDGLSWTRLVEAAPWGARAWHSFVTWADLTNSHYDISQAAQDLPPRMWLAGGGYVGRRINQVVRFIDAYYDLWWTRDGITWTQVSHAVGTANHLCTSIDAYRAETSTYYGKYGHTMLPFWQTEVDALVCDSQTLNLCTQTPVKVPALFFIGGDSGHSRSRPSAPSSDVFVSRALILCEINGQKCPYPQKLSAQSGTPSSVLRHISVDAHPVKTRAGVCPEPRTFCPDGLEICPASERPKFVLADNLTAMAGDGDVNKYTYSVYNISNAYLQSNDVVDVLSEPWRELMSGYVARLQGCLCEQRAKDGTVVGSYRGEYCEQFETLDGGAVSFPGMLTTVAITFITGMYLLDCRSERAV